MRYQIGDRFEYLGDLPYMPLDYDLKKQEFVIEDIETDTLTMYNKTYDLVICCSELELHKHFKQVFDEPAPVKPQAIVLPKENRVMDKVQKHKALCEELNAVYKQKNEKYGDSFTISVQKYGLIAALTRISDKFNRLEQLILTHSDGTADESLIDTLCDLSNYAIMTVMVLEQSQTEEEITCEGTTLD